MNLLADILKLEKTNPRLLEKVFIFGNSKYVFNIKPINSNSPVFNNFVIAKLLSAQSYIVNESKELSHNNEEEIKAIVDALNAMRNSVEGGVINKNRLSLKSKFIKIFYKGFLDSYLQRRHPFLLKKRLFIELYLYSHGLLFAQYVQYLHFLTGEPLKFGSL